MCRCRLVLSLEATTLALSTVLVDLALTGNHADGQLQLLTSAVRAFVGSRKVEHDASSGHRQPRSDSFLFGLISGHTLAAVEIDVDPMLFPTPLTLRSPIYTSRKKNSFFWSELKVLLRRTYPWPSLAYKNKKKKKTTTLCSGAPSFTNKKNRKNVLSYLRRVILR